ncbi:hypothetical protein P154DRAFT_577074 [Amniculicola lignicola CBS 123094]|uniref:Uncharacterized protein n=1 Tax=Amniculicola lignicola CBS 123094 TaxID=1392246 RepID=A0A6A5WEN2_9PLEO|nr:hypothetical protein P154DRAFT_577074 [Amniculicola lignicola CBS 123094]
MTKDLESPEYPAPTLSTPTKQSHLVNQPPSLSRHPFKPPFLPRPFPPQPSKPPPYPPPPSPPSASPAAPPTLSEPAPALSTATGGGKGDALVEEDEERGGEAEEKGEEEKEEAPRGESGVEH